MRVAAWAWRRRAVVRIRETSGAASDGARGAGAVGGVARPAGPPLPGRGRRRHPARRPAPGPARLPPRPRFPGSPAHRLCRRNAPLARRLPVAHRLLPSRRAPLHRRLPPPHPRRLRRADALAPHPQPPGSRCFASPHVRRVDFPTAVHLIRGSDPAAGLVAYAQQQDDCLRGEYAAVAGDVDAHVPWASEALGCLPEAVNLWIGNSFSVTSFHKDHYDNIYVVISGEKHFLLLPPTEHHRLYVRDYPAARYVVEQEGDGELRLKLEMEEAERVVPWSSVDPCPASPEGMAAQASSFPLYFEGPRPIRCTVRAGEMLY